ncbi:hypothetical protein I3842_08G142000 [Carya illinoinensis]|uniref:Myb/SANT-like domain-containing protein n=1 Tax=Carya illinoinensis TaxID=32201 RepID=A0A922ECC9_CARIL|nr:hypothetical protein I3842_08G142000 [Carya illinoinensis]
MPEDYASNRPGTHFNKIGWKNVVNKFSEKIGKEFCYKQLKNKWDSLKKDWNSWTKLVGKETGLGWDPVKKTIDATDEWWEKKLQEIPEADKFRNAGLAHISKLDIMFRGITAIGEEAWAPSFGLGFEDVLAEIENKYEFFRDASELLLTKSHREMFIALKDPTFQIDFIKRMKNK